MMRQQAAIGLVFLAALAALGSGCGQEGAAPAAPAPTFPTAPLIDPNTAPEAVLATVAGLGSAQVEAILAGRPFSTPSELHAVLSDGLSDDTLRGIYQVMFIRVGLNSGAEEDYKLIPSSLSPRKLAHEFEEYRPYGSIEEFTREMSKYVSDAEAAHLGRYVTLD